MNTLSLSEYDAVAAFARKASAAFLNNPDYATYGDVKPGGLFAVRWGLLDRSVLVFRIGDAAPVVFRDVLVEEA